LLSNLNLNFTGKVKTLLKIWLKDKISDSGGKKIEKDANVLLKLSIGIDSTLTNMLVILLDWSSRNFYFTKKILRKKKNLSFRPLTDRCYITLT